MDESAAIVHDRGVTWDPHGKSIGYWVRRHDGWHVGTEGVVRKAIGRPLEWVGGPILAANGTVGYCTRVAESVHAVIGADRSDPYEAVGQIVFSPTGDHHAYKAQVDQRQFVVIDGERGQSGDASYSAVYNEHGTLDDMPAFSPSGGRVAYVAYLSGGSHVVDNGNLGKRYDAIIGSPVIPTDTAPTIFGAFRNKHEFVIVGTQELGPFDRVWSREKQEYYSIRWRPDIQNGELLFAATEGHRLVLYTAQVAMS